MSFRAGTSPSSEKMLACGTASCQILQWFSDVSCFLAHMLFLDDSAALKTHPGTLRLSVKMGIRFCMCKRCKRRWDGRYLALSKSSLLASSTLPAIASSAYFRAGSAPSAERVEDGAC
jgi:hypothetical protein